MGSDCGRTCKGSRAMYKLEVDRECDGVRLWMHMQREQDNVRAGGGERA
jgi:hypothetical protein